MAIRTATDITTPSIMYNSACNKKSIHIQVRQWGLTYIHTCRSYVHTPRDTERRISSVTCTSAHLYGNVYTRVGVARALSDSSDLGLLGEQSSQKFVIPCLGRR